MKPEDLFELSTQYWDRLDEQSAESLNDEQHTLLALCYLDAQVQEGGFVQLIATGFGEYVLLNPVADNLRRWRIKAIPKVLEQAKTLYQKYGEQIEQLASDGAEVETLHQQFADFEGLDAAYYDCVDDDWQIACEYVATNSSKFIL